jgi:hypothetical protein
MMRKMLLSSNSPRRRLHERVQIALRAAVIVSAIFICQFSDNIRPSLPLALIEQVGLAAAVQQDRSSPASSGQATWPDRVLGLELILPSSGWTAVRERMDLTKNGRILTLNNFASQYLRGGLLPSGGAEIQIVADATITSLPSNDTLVREFLNGDKQLSANDLRLGSVSCPARQVESLAEFAPRNIYHTVAVFLPVTQQTKAAAQSESSLKKAVVYKFFLTYRADEPQSRQDAFKRTFSQLLSSVTAIGQTECVPPPARST